MAATTAFPRIAVVLKWAGVYDLRWRYAGFDRNSMKLEEDSYRVLVVSVCNACVLTVVVADLVSGGFGNFLHECDQ